ncbi:FGGY family carbohydrate kinase [Klebsiella pneumoniae]|nr:FGGY family carbohydrate kinase [Klebsiella pneumoniae]
MDSETRSWSSQACETFGLRVDQLPELKLSSDIIGQVTQRAADLTGLPAGIPVVAGTSDMAALCWARVCMNRGWRPIRPARRR